MTDEELELFPTSESALKMLSYVTPGFYDKSYVGKWMFQVMGLEYDKALKLAEELPEQFFPETATWGSLTWQGYIWHGDCRCRKIFLTRSADKRYTKREIIIRQ